MPKINKVTISNPTMIRGKRPIFVDSWHRITAIIIDIKNTEVRTYLSTKHEANGGSDIIASNTIGSTMQKINKSREDFVFLSRFFLSLTSNIITDTMTKEVPIAAHPVLLSEYLKINTSEKKSATVFTDNAGDQKPFVSKTKNWLIIKGSHGSIITKQAIIATTQPSVRDPLNFPVFFLVSKNLHTK
jgi:hypothetical protein